MLFCNILANGISFTGQIFDKSTGKGISYAIIQLLNTSKGTSANSEGYFDISLPCGKNILIVSSIGYNSDTLCIDSVKPNLSSNIYLNRSSNRHDISEQTKNSSAYEIAAEAILEKEKMSAGLKNYIFNAYTRCDIRENNDVGLGTGSINIDPGIVKKSFNLISNIWLSKPLKINGIDEFISKGYYKKPSSYREVVEEQNSYSSLPPSLKALLGTRRIQNLCNDELLFFNRQVPGPVSSHALNYYRYSFEDTLMMDRERIFKLHFEPVDNNDPGLTGDLYITGNSRRILKIVASLNQAANSGNTFDNVSLIQQFILFKNLYYLPVDYRIFANSNYIGIVKTRYDYSSLIERYIINEDIPDNNFSDETLSILSKNENNDSVSWADQRAIPFTPEEAVAYEKIDSIRSLPKTFFYKASKIISPRYRLNDHFSVSGPLGLYQFNHVEGHTVSFTGSGDNLFGNRIDAKLNLSHGFSDKRFKESLSTIFNIYGERGIKFSVNVYNKLNVLFSSSDRYNSFTTTIFSLLSSHDFRDYYYTKGFDIRSDIELSHFVSVYAAYSNHVDHSAQTNTTFSLLGNVHRNFNNNNFSFIDSVNAPIYDSRLNTIGLGINFDFRDDVLENNLIRKVSDGHTFVNFGAGLLISSPKYLGSDIGFISYNANILGEINTFGTSSLGFTINGVYSKGPVPIQMQYALPGNISATGRNFTFRTLGVGKMFGDQVLTLTLEYNFRKEIYRFFPISFLRNVSMVSFFNSAWKNMSYKSAAIMPVEFSLLTKPLLETGFSIGYSSLPVSIEFAWRLTHIDRGSFRIGLNTEIL